MVLRNKNILIVSPEPWNHIYVSKHHYSIHLAKKNNHVFYLNPPGKKWFLEKTVHHGVTSVSYGGFFPGLRHFPRPLRLFFQRVVFEKLQRLCCCQFDVVWSFDNSVFYDFDCLPLRVISISHIVDLNQNFQTKRAASTAHYSFCTTEQIRSRLLQYTRDVEKIGHGFNSEPSSLASIERRHDKTTAVYAGNLSMPYIDWEVLAELVKSHSEVNFLFLGPNAEDLRGDLRTAKAKQEVLQSANAKFMGTVESSALQAYYRSADILVIAYQEKHHNEQANPHKMMEYLGSGKVVVATFTSEYTQQANEHLICMSQCNSDLPHVFNNTVRNLSYWNNECLKRARVKFAHANTYEKQIQKIEGLLIGRYQ